LEKQPNSRMCYVCGIENPIGLKLKFYTDGDEQCITRFYPRPEHQGYPGHLHGGDYLQSPGRTNSNFNAL
jgi:hypothetical protein